METIIRAGDKIKCLGFKYPHLKGSQFTCTGILSDNMLSILTGTPVQKDDFIRIKKGSNTKLQSDWQWLKSTVIEYITGAALFTALILFAMYVLSGLGWGFIAELYKAYPDMGSWLWISHLSIQTVAIIILAVTRYGNMEWLKSCITKTDK